MSGIHSVALLGIGDSIVTQVDGGEVVQDTIAETVAFLPRLVGAIVILLVGWLLGRAVGRLVTGLADRVELDKLVLETPLGGMLGGTQRAVSRAFGTLARWFVYGLAILAAANVLAIPLLSEWVSIAVSYLPAFIAGLLVIVLGFVVADFIGDAILATQAATETAYTAWFAAGVRIFLYFTVIVIGLDTMGIDVSILYLFAQPLAWGLAAAIAIGFGVAIGWGGKDYVSQNIDRWMGQMARSAPSPEPERDTTTGGGTTGQGGGGED